MVDCKIQLLRENIKMSRVRKLWKYLLGDSNYEKQISRRKNYIYYR